MSGLRKHRALVSLLFSMIYIVRARKDTPSLHRRKLPMQRNVLGRGLGALIREPEQHTPAAPPAGSTGTPAPSHSVAPGGSAAAATPALSATPAGPLQIDIDLIEPSPYQPRTRFREEALDELARSIQTTGIIQPIAERPLRNRYQPTSGERRRGAEQEAAVKR